MSPTLDAPLKEGLAALAGPHTVVVSGGVVAAHGTETHLLGHLEAGRSRSCHRFPHPVRSVAGAALVLPGDRVLAGCDGGPAEIRKFRFHSTARKQSKKGKIKHPNCLQKSVIGFVKLPGYH